jgi:hypothetical protein
MKKKPSRSIALLAGCVMRVHEKWVAITRCPGCDTFLHTALTLDAMQSSCDCGTTIEPLLERSLASGTA